MNIRIARETECLPALAANRRCLIITDRIHTPVKFSPARKTVERFLHRSVRANPLCEGRYRKQMVIRACEVGRRD